MTQLSDIDQSIKMNLSNNKKCQDENNHEVFNEFINNQPCQRLIEAHYSEMNKNQSTTNKKKPKKTAKKSKQQQKYEYIEQIVNQVKLLQQEYNQMEIDNNQRRCRLSLHQDIIIEILKCKTLNQSQKQSNLQNFKQIDQIKETEDFHNNVLNEDKNKQIMQESVSKTSIENSQKYSQQSQKNQQEEFVSTISQSQNLSETQRRSIKISKQNQLHNNDSNEEKDDKDLQSTNSSNFMSSKSKTYKTQEIYNSLQQCNYLLSELASVINRKRVKIGQQLINDQILQQKQSEYCSQISLLEQKIHQMRYILNNKEDLLVYEEAAKKQNCQQIQKPNCAHQYYIDYFLPKKSNIHYRNRQQTQNIFINKILKQYHALKKQIQILENKKNKKQKSQSKNIQNQRNKHLKYNNQNVPGYETQRSVNKEDALKCQLTQRKNVYKTQPANKNAIFHVLSGNYQQSLIFKAYSMYKQQQVKKLRLLSQYEQLKKQFNEQKTKKKKLVDQYLVNCDIYQYKMKQKMGVLQNQQIDQNQYQMKEILQQMCEQTQREKVYDHIENQNILQNLKSDKQIAQTCHLITGQNQRPTLTENISKVFQLQQQKTSNKKNQVFLERSNNLQSSKQFSKKKNQHLLAIQKNIQQKNEVYRKISTRRKKSSKIKGQQIKLKQNEQPDNE